MRRSSKGKDAGLGRIIALLAVLTVLIVGYDVWCLTSGHASDGLYILPFALGAFIAIVVKIRNLPPGGLPGRWAEDLAKDVDVENERQHRLHREFEEAQEDPFAKDRKNSLVHRDDLPKGPDDTSR